MSSKSYFERSSIPSNFEMSDLMFNGLMDSPEKLQMQLINQHRKMNGCSDGTVKQNESISNTNTSPSALQEPHTSWRFYTSYDNGEWKRHCVPVYHSEADILQNNKQLVADEIHSPQIESSLRRMRLGRPALHESIQRRRLANENKSCMPSYNYQQKIGQHRGYRSEPSDYGFLSSNYYGSSPTNYNSSNNYSSHGSAASYSSALTNHSVSNYGGTKNHGTSNIYGIFDDYGASSDVNIEDIKSKILLNKSKARDFSEKVIVPTKYKTAEELALENEKVEALKVVKMLEDKKKHDEMEMNYDRSLAIRKNSLLSGRDVKVVIVNKDIDNVSRLLSNNCESVIDDSPAHVAQKVGKDMMQQMEKHVLEQFKEKFPMMDAKNAVKEKQEMYTETMNVWSEGKPNQETTICEARYETNDPITGSQNISERIVQSMGDPSAFPINKGHKAFVGADVAFTKPFKAIDQEIGQTKLFKVFEPKVETRSECNEKIIIPRKYKEAQSSENSINRNANFGEAESSHMITKRINSASSQDNFPMHSYNIQCNNITTASNGEIVDDTDSVFQNLSTKNQKPATGAYSYDSYNDSFSGRIVHEENGEKIIIPRKYQQGSIGESNSSHFRVSKIDSPSNDLTSASFGHHSSTDFRSFPSVQKFKQIGDREYQEAIY